MSRFTFNPGNGLSTGNHVLRKEDFYISYNNNPGGVISAFKGDGDNIETALCKDDKFYILNGDFRKEYEAIVDEGFDKCYEFFMSKPELHSSWCS